MAMQTTQTPITAGTNGSAAHHQLLEQFELLPGSTSGDAQGQLPGTDSPSSSDLDNAKTLLHRRLQALVDASEGTNNKLDELVTATGDVARAIDELATKVGGTSEGGEGGDGGSIPEPKLNVLRAIGKVEQTLFEADLADPNKRKSRAKSLEETRLDKAVREELQRLGQLVAWDGLFADLGEAPLADSERNGRVITCQTLRARLLRRPRQT